MSSNLVASSSVSSARVYEPHPGPLPEPFHKAIQLWRVGGWKQNAEKDGAVQKTVASPWCDVDALWMSTSVPGVSLEDVDLALNDNPETWRPDQAPYKWDRLLQTATFLPNTTPNARCFYLHTKYKPPMPLVSPRDIVMLHYWREFPSVEQQESLRDLFVSSTGRVMCAAGVDASSAATVDKAYVRGTTHVYSYWAVEQNTGVDLHIVMSFDPCGDLPSSVVNAVNASQLKGIRLMRNVVLEARRRKS